MSPVRPIAAPCVARRCDVLSRRLSRPLRRLAIAFAVCAGSAQAGVGTSLSLDDRIACQTALDEVRWSHTLWPEVNPGPKPARAEVIPDASIRAKVLDQLRKEQALVGRYGERIDRAALQAELDRMARATRAPEQLRDLYAALDDDAQQVADCLALPTLVDRRLRARFEDDDAVHGEVRAAAKRALAADASTTAAAPNSRPDEDTHILTYVRVDDPARHARDELVAGHTPAPGEIALDAEQWQSLRARLDRAAAHEATTGKRRADDTGTMLTHSTLIERSDDRLVVQVRRWEKQTFDGWWRSEAPHWHPKPLQADKAHAAHDLQLTQITGRGQFNAKNYQPGDAMPDDTWRTENAPDARIFHTAIWTGSEMIVWGGYASTDVGLLTGGRFDPTTNTWRPTATLGAPSARYSHTAVWAGTTMLVWGGYGDGGWLASGASYDPETDTWEPLPINGNSPSARQSHTAIWIGDEMIIWGGATAQGRTNTGARYRPATKTWTPTPQGSAPAARSHHTVVWTGDRMIIWGGKDTNGDLVASGGIFDRSTPQGSW